MTNEELEKWLLKKARYSNCNNVTHSENSYSFDIKTKSNEVVKVKIEKQLKELEEYENDNAG